jgi:hypothetical protein
LLLAYIAAEQGFLLGHPPRLWSCQSRLSRPEMGDRDGSSRLEAPPQRGKEHRRRRRASTTTGITIIQHGLGGGPSY